nr:MAG TPA: hypothetical protein [Caudoviricetes sp.]
MGIRPRWGALGGRMRYAPTLPAGGYRERTRIRE